ncbi:MULTISPECIES: hypothetical protein [unclassified Burkholderia]|uniref:hypothetical protein n=1 Tax=unclassified Burkholderia TaxID=2613784 RepID=UPI0015C5997D|nr:MULTISPECIES: hypothetical protein [unclassified Burkholderia]MCA8064510.1 hypothetical protein [Burkholderia sp. AU38729]
MPTEAMRFPAPRLSCRRPAGENVDGKIRFSDAFNALCRRRLQEVATAVVTEVAPVSRDAAKPGRAGSIGMQSDGSPMRIDLAPGNRTVAICVEPAIVLFD